MKEFFKKLSAPESAKIRRLISLAVSAIALLFGGIMCFVHFCSYAIVSADDVVLSSGKLTVLDVFELLTDKSAQQTGVAYLSLGLSVGWLVLFAATAIFFFKSVVAFFRSKRRLAKNTRVALGISTALALAYWLGGIITAKIVQANDGFVYKTNNSLPFVLLLIVDALYAVYAGILRWLNRNEADEALEDQEEAAFRKRKRKSVYKIRAELFVYTLLIAGLCVCALLTNIIEVEYSSSNFGSIFSVDADVISITGIDLFDGYAELNEGGQIMAFILLIMLVGVLALAFLSLISYLSKSAAFYKFAVITILFGAISCLLVGLFGQYYQIVQKVNEETILAILGSFDIDTTKIEYKVTSYSLFFFVGVVGVGTVLLLRRPYAKGLLLERELDAEKQTAETTQNIQGEISITDIPKNAALGMGGAVVTDPATGRTKVLYADPCPAFTELDEKQNEFAQELEERRQALFDSPTLPKLVQFIVNYARDSRLHLSYTAEDIAGFIAGLGTTKLSILQGMSGTGKTSLPKIFAEALYSRCELVEVESSWRDKNELLGYYNEFSKTYTPKKFTQALYRARLNPDVLTFIVLDEMNLSRIEYYFSDFLSLMENEPDKRELKLLNVPLFRTEAGEKIPYSGLTDGHTLKIPPNVWFVGTANRDESTFEISDKVYDRAYTMNFNKRAKKVTYYNEPIPRQYIAVETLYKLFEEAKKAVSFNIDEYSVIAEVEKLLAPYNISFGNRIAMQIESFVSIYCSCFAASESIIQNAVENVLLSKVVSKLELKSVDNKEQLAAEFDRLGLRKCSEFIMKLNED